MSLGYEPLRVWHVDCGRRPGGGQIQVSFLLKGLVERGVSTTLVCPPGSPIENLDLPPSVEIIHLGLRAEWDLWSILRLRRLVRSGRPHILHAHDARSHTLCLLGRTHEQRVVAHRRVSFPIRRHLFTAWKYGPGVDHFIAVAHCVRERLLRVGVAEERISVIHSAVKPPPCSGEDCDKESIRNELGLGADELIVGAVGRLTKEKRHARLLETLQPVLREHRLARVILVGSGPERSRLEHLAMRLGIRERILFTGHREDAYRLLSIFDVYVLYSESEGYPVSLAEAMASGCAVISADVGAAREIVAPERDGILVSPQDATSLKDAVSQLLADPERRATLGRAAYQSARRNLGTESMVDNTLEVYNSCYPAAV